MVLLGGSDQAPRWVRKKSVELWKKKSQILYQDSVPPHQDPIEKQLLADKCISVLQHPSHSTNLAPYYIYLFPKVNSVLKGIHFQSAD
jgi:hypothetical protein